MSAHRHPFHDPQEDSVPAAEGARPAVEPYYSEHRADGWPLCPGCREDELWSSATPATIETIVSCLWCGWKPGYR